MTTPTPFPSDLTLPVTVTYCQQCGIPTEFCSFGPNAAKCIQNTVSSLTVDAATSGSTEEEGIQEPTASTSTSSDVVRVGSTTMGKRRKQTKVLGLSSYTNINDAAKFFRNRFACGCSSEGDVIEIQGDFVDDVVMLLTEQFSVPEDLVQIEEEQQIKSAASSAAKGKKKTAKRK
ncbi:hypothetical protein RCL1_004406 [Eukaryota sp. TZLM3-RCL]